MRLLLLPTWIRRLITVPLTLALFVWAIGLLPLWLVVAGFVSRFVPGRWRLLRLVWFAFVYLVLEVTVLVALFGLWVLAGFGLRIGGERSLDRHHRLMAWFLRRLMGTARFTFGLVFDDQGDPVTESRPDRPVLVFSRHAGAGDSFLLVDAIVNGPVPRRPRIVLKDLLQFDPAIDVLLNRVGASFVGGRSGSDVVAEIERLAGTASARDAVVLFPEGGNVTEARRARAVEQLDLAGRPDLAERARRLQNMLPPKPRGALAAIAAAPDATVVFVGHVGLEALSTPRDVWRHLPMDHVISSRSWRVHAEDIPPPDRRELWLYDQWETIDTWIDETLVAHEERRALAAAAAAAPVPRRSYRERLTAPVSATAVAVALLLWWESLRPSLLPRSPLIQGAVGALSAAVGVAIGTFLNWSAGRVRIVTGRRIPSVWHERLVSLLMTISLPLVVIGAVRWLRWQREQRELVAMSALSAWSMLPMLLVTALLLTLLMLIGRSVWHLVTLLDRGIGRVLRVSWARWVAVAVVTVVAVWSFSAAFGRFGAWADQSFGTFDTTTRDGVEPPTSATVSGGPGSLVSWDDLGYEGRNFAGGVPTREELAATAAGAPVLDPVRVYVGLDSAPDDEARVGLAVAELERTGAFERSVLVVVTPTGTGWVDPDAARAIEHMYRGDTAIVSVQYSFLPSWIAFLLDTESPRRLGVSLFDGVHAAWAALPVDDRPELVVFGESLGSMGGEQAFAAGDLDASIDRMTSQADALLWTGPTRDNAVFSQLVDGRDPGSRPWRPVSAANPEVRVANEVAEIDPADASWVSPRVLYLHHASDAIGTWAFDNAVSSPGWARNPPPLDVSAAARWTPIVSVVQETFDLMNGFSASPGHGHDYSIEFVDAWAAVAPPPGWTPADTDRLRTALLGS